MSKIKIRRVEMAEPLKLKFSNERMHEFGVAYDEHLADFARLGDLVGGENADGPTGIYVRGQTPSGKWVSGDIAFLEKDSLLAWLKSRGGDNPWAENVVGILLGHGNLHEAGNLSEKGLEA